VTGWLIEQAHNMQVQPSSPSTDNTSATVAPNTDQPPAKRQWLDVTFGAVGWRNEYAVQYTLCIARIAKVAQRYL